MGNAFFAAIASLNASSHRRRGQNAVRLFGLRGRETITTSGIVMLDDYARKLQPGGTS